MLRNDCLLHYRIITYILPIFHNNITLDTRRYIIKTTYIVQTKCTYIQYMLQLTLHNTCKCALCEYISDIVQAGKL